MLGAMFSKMIWILLVHPSGEEPIKSISNVEVKHGRGLDDDDDDVF